VYVEQIAHLVADGRAVLEGGTALAVDEDPNEPPGLHPEALEFHEFQAFGLDQRFDQSDDLLAVRGHLQAP
jgi:hypothetical protein